MEFLPLAAIALVFWLFIVRPASRRQKEVARLQSSLAPGNRVLLSSGLFATVQETFDDRIRAEIAPGVVVDVARGAVAAIEPSPGPGGPEGLAGPEQPGGPTAPGA
ncbi:preprotein translocase subunit YajC [Nocardioides solisilvae]|uniref:preprotein translocase subunit YajC n=1 Tax=Nocardioides solisilvae TaxID=1542435 RepID=UPI000D74BC97|nr:preprotein translocase subunit YajC [Nocardioides solisilvae]